MAERFCPQSWLSGGARFNHRSRLSTYQFGDFRGFPRNSRKYGIGPLIKTPTVGTPRTGPGFMKGQLALTLQPNPTQDWTHYHYFFMRYSDKRHTHIDHRFIIKTRILDAGDLKTCRFIIISISKILSQNSTFFTKCV